MSDAHAEKPKIENDTGCLSEYANPILRQLEKEAGKQAAVSKSVEKIEKITP